METVTTIQDAVAWFEDLERSAHVVLEQERPRIFSTFLSRGIANDAELFFFLLEFLHYRLPDQPVCQHHVAPFTFLSDLFFERVRSVFGYANRTGGKTQNLAILHFLNAVFKGVEVCSAGAVLHQSQKCYNYFINLWYHEPLVMEYITVLRSVQSLTQLSNGGSVQIVSGTPKGLNGPHPCKSCIDEIELIPWSVLQEGLSMAKDETTMFGMFKGQDVLTSTKKQEQGSVSRILEDSQTRGIQVYKWCLFETLKTCTHDCHNFGKDFPDDPVLRKFKQCPLYEARDKDGNAVPICHGVAHRSNGYLSIEEAAHKFLVLDYRTFELQWLCRDAVSETAVYGYFYNSVIHELPSEEWEALMTRKYGSQWKDRVQSWTHVGGIDFGGFFVSLLCVLEPNPLTNRPNWWVLAEHATTPEQDWLNHQHVHAIKQLPFFTSSMVWYADSAQAQDIKEFRALGLPVAPADKAVFAGIDHVKSLLQRRPEDQQPSLRILSDRCPTLCKQMKTYAHPTTPDGKVDRDRILKQNDHAPDALRYAVYSYLRSRSVVRGSLRPLKAMPRRYSYG